MQAFMDLATATKNVKRNGNIAFCIGTMLMKVKMINDHYWNSDE